MLSKVSEKRQDAMLPPHYLTPPYLSAEPEVTQHKITNRDKFLVLATDGLWELMHRQTVVQLVAQQLTGQRNNIDISNHCNIIICFETYTISVLAQAYSTRDL